MGGVFTDKFIVQRLTDMRWMALASTEEDVRIYHNARVLVALRRSLSNLATFYEGLRHQYTPFDDDKPHPRYFPYPTSFVAKDGGTTSFRYLYSLEDDPACVTYRAVLVNRDNVTEERQVVVKFVSRYSQEVHEFLARHERAPTLLYVGPLTHSVHDDGLPRLAQNAPPGLCLRSDLMHMVVMDFIERGTRPPDAREQVEDILKLLHLEGYVFGDLRADNIICDADAGGRVKLIDFNWCGRYNRETTSDLPANIDEKKARVQIGGPYARYPLSMSSVKEMWADGMYPLEEIRPEHDRDMCVKLGW
jgi:hypothetical protein